jgi:hypothetical protein
MIFAVGAIASTGAWLERLTTFGPQAGGSSKGNFWKFLGALLDPRLPGNEKAIF